MDYSDLQLPEFVERQKAMVKAPAGIVVQPLSVDHPLLKKWLFTLIQENHRFAELHKAWADGWLIHVPKGVVCTEPIVIDHSAQSGYAQHVLIVAEESVTVVEKRESLEGHTFASHGTEIVVGDGATVRFVSMQDYSDSVFQFDYKNAHVGKNARMEWVDCCLGSTFTHSTMRSLLAGEGGVSIIKGLFVGNGSQRFDVGAQVIHAAPHTTSDISGRGVLNGKAKNIYRGLVRIERNAPGSNGFQKEDVLMLSEDAEADAIPQLEIDNNDVKCSHAATTTHVDKEKLFYLMARGLNEKDATRLMVDGFFAPFIDAVGELGVELAEKIEAKVRC
jgi:Fe-S cluster assembly protein SufD